MKVEFTNYFHNLGVPEIHNLVKIFSLFSKNFNLITDC